MSPEAVPFPHLHSLWIPSPLEVSLPRKLFSHTVNWHRPCRVAVDINIGLLQAKLILVVFIVVIYSTLKRFNAMIFFVLVEEGKHKWGKRGLLESSLPGLSQGREEAGNQKASRSHGSFVVTVTPLGQGEQATLGCKK